MTIELRELRADGVADWFGTAMTAFGGVQMPEEKRGGWLRVIEPERSIAAWDESQLVGTTGAYSFRMVVPGGALVPTAGVTFVTVLPTHRRRGLLTSMMRRQLDDVRQRGEPLAALLASEPDIYGRFGYGAATQVLSAEIDTARVTLRMPEGADAVRIRFADPEESLAACETVYERLLYSRPGTLARPPGWAEKQLSDIAPAPGQSQLQAVLATTDDGEVAGYARYTVTPQNHSGEGTVTAHAVQALTPAAEAALWRYLFGIDLTSVVRTRATPVDAPWQHLVSDIRRCGVSYGDGMYVRIVDVPGALEARTYLTPVDVVLDVTDLFCPWNEGRWRLFGDSSGASCKRTEDPADLALSARELGAAYLGGVSLTALAGAGRVTPLREGALAQASAAFGSHVAPWFPHGF
ncbi:GNAT family N-acetyltransferase [Streptomyces sp. A7024]|uniref:GNAT family N-acetyltransferase n=1 Tax=Streptomyces coryli TaxID=1128680 RepID=A0A6G4TW00_9ACTN|nr:GNAT family N-acetyltransferase [Streptomyces coryli]NGN63288.1 GNAT family N-acetyltransferase [Streptomyces coryli]